MVDQAFLASVLDVTKEKLQEMEATDLFALEVDYRRVASTRDAVEQTFKEAGCGNRRVEAGQIAGLLMQARKPKGLLPLA